jgi:hypothetical protein
MLDGDWSSDVCSSDLANLPKGSLLAKHRGSFAPVTGSSAVTAEKGGFLSGIVDKLTAKE